MDILEVIDKLKELDYDEITIDSPDFKLCLKREGSPMVSPMASEHLVVQEEPATRVIDTIVNEAKAPGLASTKQVKYVKDVMMKDFEGHEEGMLNYLCHLLEVPLIEVPHPESWEKTLTIEMAEMILNDYERKNNISKRR